MTGHHMRGSTSPTSAGPSPFLPAQGHDGIVILDGGLATTLEARGFDLNDPLWSARLLVEAPNAIRQVHFDFLVAGADCITSASYQASLEGFARRGIPHAEGIELLRRSVRLALEARDDFWRSPGHRVGRRRPLVAASVGPYGAYLADGSEYSGAYAADDAALLAFHRERWHVLAASDADVLACETIPSARESAVLLELLGETPAAQAWLSFSCGDGEHLWDGTPIVEVGRRCDTVPNVAAIGVNCVRPEFVLPLLRALRQVTEKPLIAYPNAGEDYDVASRSWRATRPPVDWAGAAAAWIDCGVRGIGGCCRVGPEQIAALRKAVQVNERG